MIYLSRNHRGILLTLLLTFLLIEAAPRKPGITDEKSNNQEESGNSDNKGKNAGPEGSGENSLLTNGYKLGDQTNMTRLRNNIKMFSVNQMAYYHVLILSCSN